MPHQDSYYPIALDLHRKPCLVVGGGLLADGKLDGLLAAGARLTVVSPEVRPRIAALAAEGRFTLHQRDYLPTDVAGMYLVIGATDDRAVNAAVANAGRAVGALVNAVDDIPNCDFFAVAIVRRGDLQVAISTNGRSPAFARWLRERLDDAIPPAYGDLLAALGDVRQTLRERGPIPAYEHWKPAIDDETGRGLGRDDRAMTTARLLARVGAGVPTGHEGARP